MARDVANRKLRAGIVGGGKGSFIGAVHRIAAELDDQAEVIAGAMSTDLQRAEISSRLVFAALLPKLPGDGRTRSEST